MRRTTRTLGAAIVALLIASLLALPSDADLPPPLGATTTTTTTTTAPQQPPPSQPPAPAPASQSQFPPLPADSGVGRRVVYSKTDQRVWLVEEDGTVSHSWLVSGRRNLPKVGQYRVFSRSMWSRSGSSRLQYMVRFAKGRRLRIGFHAIPINRRGQPIQSESQLGTPRSNGCVRQRNADAETLWNWAPLGTVVRVTP